MRTTNSARAICDTACATGTLSINDHPQIRDCFAGLAMETLDISYTVGGGARPAERKELVIWSWGQAAELAGLF